MVIMSVVYLDLISTFPQQHETYLFLIDSDMIMPMSVIMSMSMTVSVMMVTTRCVHPEQIDCQSNAAHP